MDENLSRGYIQLNRQPRCDERDHDAPHDNYHFVYLGLVLAGIGFLLPYNSFIIACDYFQDKYPNKPIIFDMSLIYILVAFVAVCVNNALVEALSFSTRIAFGYFVSLSTLLFVLVFEIGLNIFDSATGYNVNLMAVSVVAFGCTVQQSSFYGYTSMLPARYTQAVMTGESAAGLIVSLNRIATKLLLKDERINTMLFYLVSILLIVSCIVIYSRLEHCCFVRYYLRQCSTRNTMFLAEHLQAEVRSELLNKEDSEDVGLVDTNDDTNSRSSRNAVLSFQSPPTSPTTQSAEVQRFVEDHPEPDAAQIEEELANYGLAANQIRWLLNNDIDMSEGHHRFKVQDVVVKIRGTATTKRAEWLSAVRKGIVDRSQVSTCIWPYMLSIALAYFVTLCLFPGIESQITSCRLQSWMPVLLMAIFNFSDFVGKMLASLSYELNKSALVYLSLARIILVPLLAACALPRASSTSLDDFWAMFLSLILGVTNGILGSVPMIVAPTKVPHQHRELTGNIMTLSYSVGLTTGSLVAYLIKRWVKSSHTPICATDISSVVEATTVALLTPQVLPNATYLNSSISAA